MRPAGESRLDLEPPPLARVVAFDLVAKRWAGTDERHLTTYDVPELRQLVEREPSQQPSDPGDARVTAVNGVTSADALGADDHRAQLEQFEVPPVESDTRLAVERRAAVGLDGERGYCKHRTRDDERARRERDVERAVQRVPSATFHVAGTPRRR